VRTTNVVNHMLDKEDMEGLRLLLAAGVEPNHVNERGETSLHWAVWREVLPSSRPCSMPVRDRGVAPGRPAPRTRWRYRAGKWRRRICSPAAAPIGKCRSSIASWAIAQRPVPRNSKGLLASSPEWKLPDEYARLLPDLASSHCSAGVRAFLAAGVPVDSRGELGGTTALGLLEGMGRSGEAADRSWRVADGGRHDVPGDARGVARAWERELHSATAITRRWSRYCGQPGRKSNDDEECESP
jgi:hypothetical protein